MVPTPEGVARGSVDPSLGKGLKRSVWTCPMTSDQILLQGEGASINLAGTGATIKVVINQNHGGADHSELTGRATADGHPIAAITGLQDAINTATVSTVQVLVSDPAVQLTTDDTAYIYIPSQFNGRVIESVHAALVAPSSVAGTSLQLTRTRGVSSVDVLSTPTTIDINETSSYTASVPHVVATGGLETGDLLRLVVQSTGAGAMGLMVIVTVSA